MMVVGRVSKVAFVPLEEPVHFLLPYTVVPDKLTGIWTVVVVRMVKDSVAAGPTGFGGVAESKAWAWTVYESSARVAVTVAVPGVTVWDWLFAGFEPTKVITIEPITVPWGAGKGPYEITSFRVAIKYSPRKRVLERAGPPKGFPRRPCRDMQCLSPRGRGDAGLGSRVSCSHRRRLWWGVL